MKRSLGLALVIASFAACLPQQPTTEEGGANANDRTFGGEQGEQLLTGVMEISPNGHFAIMQRNTVTVLFDFQKQAYVELSQQLQRVALSKTRDVGYALLADGALVAIDLATTNELWRAQGTYAGATLLRVTDLDDALVVASASSATVIDPETGATRGVVVLPSEAAFATFLPKAKKAVLVAKTSWTAHKPATPVFAIDLVTAKATRVDVPNCEAPPVALPTESRVLLSPTFCEEGRASNPDDKWTNPDPVSVIDVKDGALSFVKNLPGFGPVALSPDGKRAVAYLDTKRVDPSMFTDKSQIPGSGAPEYHLLVIDPASLAFTVSPIGDGLPRFAMSRDGSMLLVDSSIKVIHRAEASADASVTLGPNGFSGQVDVSAKVFDEQTPFGAFDLASLHFAGFQGPQAGLDRFVQLGDERTVVTLQKRSDGLGGVPFLIDLQAKTTVALQGDYGTGVRDVGILPDGKTIVLRFRLAAAQVGNQLFARESYCLSFDGLSCAGGRVDYQASIAFATADSNDCANMGHDCW